MTTPDQDTASAPEDDDPIAQTGAPADPPPSDDSDQTLPTSWLT